MHYHLDFTETFSALEGKLDLYLGRQRKHLILNPGESVTAQLRQLHTFANERDSSRSLWSTHNLPAVSSAPSNWPMALPMMVETHPTAYPKIFSTAFSSFTRPKASFPAFLSFSGGSH
jgi:hypothetical protein